MDVQAFLAKQFLFESLSPDQIELIAETASVRMLKRGEHLFSELQPASAFFIVVSGSVKIYKLSAQGGEHILHIQYPGDLVAEAVIFDFDTYPAYCVALEDTVLLRFGKEEFLTTLRHFPEITFKIMSAYSRRLRMLVTKIEELSLHDVKSRLANYLLNNYVVRANRCVVSLPISKKDLAATLGTVPETLSRTLNFMKREKIIAEDQSDIIILNLKKLKEMVSS